MSQSVNVSKRGKYLRHINKPFKMSILQNKTKNALITLDQGFIYYINP